MGALLSRDNMDNARVWYTKATPSVCPGCERGCTINIWHRKPEWALKALDPQLNTRIERVTPLENPAVNGPWICNKARDLAQLLERPRATQAMVRGAATPLADATAAATATFLRRSAIGALGRGGLVFRLRRGQIADLLLRRRPPVRELGAGIADGGA